MSPVGTSRAKLLGIITTVGALSACGSDAVPPVDAATYGNSPDASSGMGLDATGLDDPGIDSTSGDDTRSGEADGEAGSFGSRDGDGGLSDDGGETGSPEAAGNDGSASDSSSERAPCLEAGAIPTASQAGYLGDWVAGDYPSDFSDAGTYLTISGVAGQQGNVRQYAVHVPTGYSKDTPVPALFCIHGFGQSATLFCLDTGVAWPTKADQEGFVVIMPNGYMNSWNAGTCCGNAASAGLDDVALMRAIFAEVAKHVNIDLRRVYATGLSNGGYLSYRLACQASDLFVAVAPAAGAVGTVAIGGTSLFGMTSDLATCAPTHKVSIFDIHGTNDPLIPYSTQAPSLALMQSSNGCSAATVPATVVPSGGDTTCVSYTGCPSCPKVDMTACSVADGGHCWFGSSDCGTGAGALGMAFVGNNSNFMKNTDAVWAFLSGISR